MRRNNGDKKAKSILDMLGNDQMRTVGVREGEQERCWNPGDDLTPMEEVSAGRWGIGAASSIMTPSASGIQKIRQGVCEGAMSWHLRDPVVREMTVARSC